MKTEIPAGFLNPDREDLEDAVLEIEFIYSSGSPAYFSTFFGNWLPADPPDLYILALTIKWSDGREEEVEDEDLTDQMWNTINERCITIAEEGE